MLPCHRRHNLSPVSVQCALVSPVLKKNLSFDSPCLPATAPFLLLLQLSFLNSSSYSLCLPHLTSFLNFFQLGLPSTPPCWEDSPRDHERTWCVQIQHYSVLKNLQRSLEELHILSLKHWVYVVRNRPRFPASPPWRATVPQSPVLSPLPTLNSQTLTFSDLICVMAPNTSISKWLNHCLQHGLLPWSPDSYIPLPTW